MNDKNRSARDFKRLTMIRRWQMVLDLAAIDLVVDGDRGEECFFCGVAIVSSKPENQAHAPNCVWLRAKREEHGILKSLKKILDEVADPVVKSAAVAALGGQQ